MLEISGRCFSVHLIHELTFFVFVPILGSASYTWVRLIRYTVYGTCLLAPFCLQFKHDLENNNYRIPIWYKIFLFYNYWNRRR